MWRIVAKSGCRVVAQMKGAERMNITLRPEMRTDSAEAVSIFKGQDWVGDAYIIYREGELLKGAIQVDSMSVTLEEYPQVVAAATQYVTDLAHALRVADASVVGLYGDIRTVYDDGQVNWETDPDDTSDDPEDGQLLL